MPLLIAMRTARINTITTRTPMIAYAVVAGTVEEADVLLVVGVDGGVVVATEVVDILLVVGVVVADAAVVGVLLVVETLGGEEEIDRLNSEIGRPIIPLRPSVKLIELDQASTWVSDAMKKSGICWFTR